MDPTPSPFSKKGIPICGLNHLRGKNRLSNEKTLAVHGTYGITLASYTRCYVGIIISHHKDPYENTSIYTVMENQRVPFGGSFEEMGSPKNQSEKLQKKIIGTNELLKVGPENHHLPHFIPDQSVLVGG